MGANRPNLAVRRLILHWCWGYDHGGMEGEGLGWAKAGGGKGRERDGSRREEVRGVMRMFDMRCIPYNTMD